MILCSISKYIFFLIHLVTSQIYFLERAAKYYHGVHLCL